MLEYQEILPAERLREYVKCYFIVRIENHFDFADIKYPNGQIELAFNLGESSWQSEIDNKIQIDPKVELLGQLTRPMLIKSAGKTLMLCIRFYSHTAGYFFDHSLEEYNNQILDLREVMGKGIKGLYEQLLNEPALNKRIELIDNFLIKRLSETVKNDKLILLSRITNDLHRNPEKNVKHMADQYNISPRHMQRLFLRYIGITPKLYGRINRFQQILQYINENEEALTAVAYKFGYADQSHFIKDFKSFSDKSPSIYDIPKLPFQ